LLPGAGAERLMLRGEGADVFSGDGRRYTFVSDAAGRVQGVRIVDPGYDVAATENSVVYLGRNDAPTDARGPNRPGGAALPGPYAGRFAAPGTTVGPRRTAACISVATTHRPTHADRIGPSGQPSPVAMSGRSSARR